MLIDCPFQYSGCDAKHPRKDMPEHMKDTATHLTLLASVTHSLVKENQQFKVKLERQTQTLVKQNQALVRENQQFKVKLERQTQTLVKQNQALVRENQQFKVKLERQTQTLVKQNQALVRENQQFKEKLDATEEEVGKLKLAVTGFPKVYQVKKTDEEVYLPGFYTHHNGYKMCLRFAPNGNGSGKGTHVSIFTYLMKGSYDFNLKWPFRGEITVQIVNQARDHSSWQLLGHLTG